MCVVIKKYKTINKLITKALIATIYCYAIAFNSQTKMENTNKVERSKLWNEIYAIVKQIPRKETNEDAVDALSATTSIENIIEKRDKPYDKIAREIVIKMQFQKEIDKIRLSNKDINSWGDGFEYAIQLVYKALNK